MTPLYSLACLPLASHAHIAHPTHAQHSHNHADLTRDKWQSAPALQYGTPSRVAVELSSRKLVPCPGTLANRGGRGQANRG